MDVINAKKDRSTDVDRVVGGVSGEYVREPGEILSVADLGFVGNQFLDVEDIGWRTKGKREKEEDNEKKDLHVDGEFVNKYPVQLFKVYCDQLENYTNDAHQGVGTGSIYTYRRVLQMEKYRMLHSKFDTNKDGHQYALGAFQDDDVIAASFLPGRLLCVE